MPQEHTLKIVARMRSDFADKFGIPRQSGLVPALEARVVFEPEYRDPEALRGLEGFSHIWLLWEFSQARRETWSPTVRPPRLGGNVRMGVFATRSPFRPSPIGLSCVELAGIDLHTPEGPTAGPAPGPGLPPERPAAWRWISRRSCWPGCRRRSGRPCGGCWPRIPAPPIRRIRRGFTACASAAWRSGSAWRGTP